MIGCRGRPRRGLDWPPCASNWRWWSLRAPPDGCTDATAARAATPGRTSARARCASGRSHPRRRASRLRRGELIVFSDADSRSEPGAIARSPAFRTPPSATPAARSVFHQAGAGPAADNQEGLYWRYEMAVRTSSHAWRSVTAGNGGFYAVRRSAYVVIDPRMDHDIYFPFHLVKRGLRAVYVPRRAQPRRWSLRSRASLRASVACEPCTGHRAARRHAVPRGYGLRYGWMMPEPPRAALQRLGAAPGCARHECVFAGPRPRLRRDVRLCRSPSCHRAALGRVAPFRSLATTSDERLDRARLWDYLRQATPTRWEAAEGTR